jgi:protein arginine kinase activator
MFEKVCSKCGTRLSEYYRTYMLGCPECYKAFEEEIVNTLTKTQGKTYHIGKAPKITPEEKGLIDEYNLLMTEKEKAGLEGRFSDMAKISNRLALIKEELSRRGLI